MYGSESFIGAEHSIQAPQAVADVGVLFVHGIGHHEAGSTLRHMGGGLATYVQQRLSLDPNAEVRIGEQAAVRGESAGTLNIVIRASDGRKTVWRLSEARWDGSFDEPSIGEVVRWGLVVAPWVLHREAFRWWARRRPIRVRRLLLRLLTGLLAFFTRFIAFTLAAIALQVFVLFALAFLWIRPVRRVLDAILVRTVGDAYRFVDDPDSLNAMSKIVADELQRLSSRCRKVMVVAHSQGVAVAQGALELRRPPPNFERLVTLGAGLMKLHALQELRYRSGFLAFWTVMRLVLVVLVFSVGQTVGETTGPANLDGAALLLLLFAPMRGVPRGQRRIRARIAKTPGFGNQWTWLDLWSTRDLVPDGSLRMDGDGGERAVISLQVDNSASWINDHVTYLSNPGQVLPLVYGVAAHLAGLSDSTLVRHVSWVWLHRRRRARSRGRGLLLTPVIWTWARRWNRWEMRCRELEPHGQTVPATWFQLRMPSFWKRLPAVSCPSDSSKRADRQRETLLHQAMTGPPLRTLLVDEEWSPPPLPRRLRWPVVVVIVATAALAGLAVLASPVLVDTMEGLFPNETGRSPTALIAGALLEPWVVWFAVATVILPGIVLDALGELFVSGRLRSSARRLSVIAVAIALGIAAIGLGAGTIISLTVRAIPTLSVGDCFDSRPSHPSRRPDNRVHFDVVRIPCHEVHQGELLAAYPFHQDVFSSYEPQRLAMEVCDATFPEIANQIGAGFQRQHASAISVNAYVPRFASPKQREKGGVYCFLASSRCESGFVGR
jgi:hypothetical protein